MQKRVNEQLCNAIGRGNEAKVMEILAGNPECVNSADEFGWSPLHIAASLDRAGMCRIIVQSGADICALDKNSSTALDLALTRGYFDICKVLVEAGAKIKNEDLIKCSRTGDTEICEYLLQLGVPVNFSAGTTALHGACEWGNIATIRLLLDHKADPTIKNKNNETVYDTAGTNNKKMSSAVLKELRWHKRKMVVLLASGHAMPTPGHSPNIVHRLPQDVSRYIALMM